MLNEKGPQQNEQYDDLPVTEFAPVTHEHSIGNEGEQIETYRITEPGWYGVELGLPHINPEDKRWYHGAHVDEKTRLEKPFVLDTEHHRFQSLSKKFLEKIEGVEPVECIHTMIDLVNRAVKSDMADEHATSVSEILQVGRGACMSKTLIGGLLVKETIENAKASYVVGQLGQVGHKLSYPFSHAWLRIQIGNVVGLCDLMYDKYQILQIVDEEVFEIKGNYDFSRNAVENRGLANLIDRTGAHAGGSPQLVFIEEFDPNDKAKRVFMKPSIAFESQVFGTNFADIYLPKPSEFKTINGDYIAQTKKSPENSGPVVRYPFLGIQRRA